MATSFGTWLALNILGMLGRLPKEREEILIRRRDNRIKKREEQRKSRDPNLTPNLPGTEKAGNETFQKGNIPENDGRDDANGPVHSRSFPQAMMPRQRLPTIDEENLVGPTGIGQTKAKTFNGFHRGFR